MHVLAVYDMLITFVSYIYITITISRYILVSPLDTLKIIPLHGYYSEEISDIKYPYMIFTIVRIAKEESNLHILPLL